MRAWSRGPLISWIPTVDGTDGGDRVAGVVEEDVGGLVSRGRRVERAVARRRVRPPAAVQVVVRPHRSGERPLVLVAPLVDAHHEDAHRRLGGDAVVDPLEPVVEPADLQSARCRRRCPTSSSRTTDRRGSRRTGRGPTGRRASSGSPGSWPSSPPWREPAKFSVVFVHHGSYQPPMLHTGTSTSVTRDIRSRGRLAAT